MNTSVLTSVENKVGPVLAPLTVQQYHAMISSGILHEGEPIELIDGLLVRKDRRDSQGNIMTVGPRHAEILKQLIAVLTQVLAGVDGHIHSQLPITLTGFSEPEPDVCFVAGSPRDYHGRHPGPADVLLVVEVADSSLSNDRGKKAELYAAAGITQYWIVNLKENVVEVFERPLTSDSRYLDHTTCKSTQTLSFTLDDQSFEIDLKYVF